MRVFLITCLFAMVIPLRTHSLVIRVPADRTTIQAGIDSATPGDTVLVSCGTYYEHNMLVTRPITIRSEQGDPACATIDAQMLERVFVCQSVDPGLRIEGFTLTGGRNAAGAGMLCSYTAPIVSDCAFVSNHASTDGGGAYLFSLFFDMVAQFTRCVFRDNQCGQGFGGGIGAVGVRVAATDCLFIGNDAGIGGALSISDVEGSARTAGGGMASSLTRCTLIGNTAQNGGAVACEFGNVSVSVSSCTFFDNEASGPGGGVIS